MTVVAAATKTYEKVLNLPVPMRDSKMLLKLLRLQLQADPPAGGIVKITLGADPARPRSTQHGLFVPNSPDPEKLELTVARLAKLVGNANIGSPELMDTHRPGEFRMSKFFAQPNETRARGKASRKSVADGEAVARGRRRVAGFFGRVWRRGWNCAKGVRRKYFFADCMGGW